MDLYERGLERLKGQNLSEKELIEFYENIFESKLETMHKITNELRILKKDNKDLKNKIKILYDYTDARFTEGNYIRIAKYNNVEELLEKICNCEDRKYILDNGYTVKPKSLRYQTFYHKGLECVCCGIKGSFLALEKDFCKSNINTFHLNLYAIDKDGNEVLMTKDHINPKSNGGQDILDNMQTMCKTCNERKGNKIEF